MSRLRRYVFRTMLTGVCAAWAILAGVYILAERLLLTLFLLRRRLHFPRASAARP